MKQFPVSCVIMASGFSRRFGSNKLLADYNGKPLMAHMLDSFPKEAFLSAVVVTRYPPVAQMAEERGFSALLRPEETEDISGTIRVGVGAADPRSLGCLFAVSDQPGLTGESVLRLGEAFAQNSHRIVALSCEGKRGNPVIFPKALFGELASLPEGSSGGRVIEAHSHLLMPVEASSPGELMDVDTKADYEALQGGEGPRPRP